MTSFDYLWQMLYNHGVIERYKTDCARIWGGYTLEQQRYIYRSIRNNLRAGRFVNYNPIKAIQDNAPKRKPPQTLTFNEYYERYHTTLEQDGWKMINPTGQQVIYVRG